MVIDTLSALYITMVYGPYGIWSLIPSQHYTFLWYMVYMVYGLYGIWSLIPPQRYTLLWYMVYTVYGH